MKFKKSQEEAQATAMLLGMNYDAVCHIFYKLVFRNDKEGSYEHLEELCADTLEPVSREEIHKRVGEWQRGQ